VGAKVKRRHDAPRTPCERLLASPDVSVESKSRLKSELARLNPFELHRPLHSRRPSDSLHCAADAGTSIVLKVS